MKVNVLDNPDVRAACNHFLQSYNKTATDSFKPVPISIYRYLNKHSQTSP